jgi:phage terminase small subunit
MRQRGRISAAAAEFMGVNHGRGILQPPDDLTPREAEIFRELTAGTHPDHFVPSDRPLLAAYCRALVNQEFLSREMKRKLHLAEHYNTIMRSLFQLATKLRLCPSGRYSNRRAASKSRVHNRQPSAYDMMDLEND